MDIKVGHLPDPYRLNVAYADGQSVGSVEKFVMNEPDPNRLGPTSGVPCVRGSRSSCGSSTRGTVRRRSA